MNLLWGRQDHSSSLRATLHVGAPVSGVADVSAPTLSSTSPTDDATGVVVTANLTATFSESVLFGTGSFKLYTAADLLVEDFDVEADRGTGNGKISVSGAVVTVNPTASMAASTGHYMQIDATAIDDHSGNSYAGIADKTTWSWTTA